MDPAQHSLPLHIERYLGTIRHGWSKDINGVTLPFQVVECSGEALGRGVRAFSTLGLSNIELASAVSGKSIWQELVIVATDGIPSGSLVGTLQGLANDAVTCGNAYVRGEVVGQVASLRGVTKCDSVYFAVPSFVTEEFGTFRRADGVAVVIGWCLLISMEEAEFVMLRGWREFEDRLEASECDVFDANRPSIDLSDPR